MSHLDRKSNKDIQTVLGFLRFLILTQLSKVKNWKKNPTSKMQKIVIKFIRFEIFVNDEIFVGII